jgi:hypothetical protein
MNKILEKLINTTLKEWALVNEDWLCKRDYTTLTPFPGTKLPSKMRELVLFTGFSPQWVVLKDMGEIDNVYILDVDFTVLFMTTNETVLNAKSFIVSSDVIEGVGSSKLELIE